MSEASQTETSPERYLSQGGRLKRLGWLGPAVALGLVLYFSFVFVMPVIQAFWYALTIFDIQTGASRFTGLANFERLLGDAKFWTGVRVAFVFAIGQFAVGTVLALALGWMLTTLRGRRRSVVLLLFCLPAILPNMVVTVVWKAMLQPDRGLLDLALASFGFPTAGGWLGTGPSALFWIVTLTTWKLVGFGAVFWMSGLNEIPDELHEAAALDGAGEIRRFFSISLPLLRPLLLFQFVASAVTLLQLIDPFLALTIGGPAGQTETLILYVYNTSFHRLNFSYASAMTVVFFLGLLVFSATQLRLWRRYLQAE